MILLPMDQQELAVYLEFSAHREGIYDPFNQVLFLIFRSLFPAPP